MSRQLIRLALSCLCVAALLGAKGGCSVVVSAEKLCTESGGVWDNSECPRSCWPPACGADAGVACADVCGEEPVCACPADKPYWKDGQGCWSQADCSKKCVGSATSCFMEFGSFCTFQDGCHEDCDTDSHGHEDCDCHGFARECDTYDDPDACAMQDGCRWE